MGQHNLDQILKEDTMDNNKDGKSKYNKESMLRYWKTLKRSIEPVDFVLELDKNKFLSKLSFDGLEPKLRSHQATIVLIKVYRKVQSSDKNYKKFVEILGVKHSIAADVLRTCVGGPINKPETVDKLQIELTRAIMKKFEEKIENKLKKNPDVVLEILDTFIECGILDIDTVEKILRTANDLLKEVAQPLVKFVIKNIDIGAYNLLLEILKSVKQLNGLVSELTTAGDGEDIKTAKPILQERRMPSPDVTRETADAFKLSINGDPENPELNNALLARHSPVGIAVFNNFGSTTDEGKEGSAIFRFAHKGSKNVIAVQHKIQQGAMTRVIGDITHLVNLTTLKDVNVKLTCLNYTDGITSTAKLQSGAALSRIPALQNKDLTQVEQKTTESLHHTTESEQHTMNVTIIAANRSFLIEEINTMALVRAFQVQGITYFDRLDGTLGRQQRAERFLTILEENNDLLDQLLVILREQGMASVFDRLNNCRNAYLADPQILEPNIFNNRTDILHNLDIDDVREIFIERDAFNSSMFDEIEEKYSGSEDQMSAVLIEIIKSGPRAMRILVDALYINQLDSLAESLLMETPTELQEIQDNKQIDESSSDGELLYEATFILSKADEKSPFHQMPEDNTISVPSK